MPCHGLSPLSFSYIPLRKVYRARLLKKDVLRKVPHNVISNIFANIDRIYDVHTRLLDQLRSRLAEWCGRELLAYTACTFACLRA